ncbi:MAG: FAD-dependent oxidoreductase, partial [Treponema sp.]|nr:FAD-dependent oxidoreductase [Treponema sp.]
MNISYKTEIPLESGYDVIVAGGGPAGCAAALAAARHGKKVLLLEYSSSLGGMGTGGLVPAWCPFSDMEKVIYRGIGLEIFDKLKAEMPHLKKTDVDWVPIDAEALKRILDRLLTEAKVDVIFNAMVVDAGVETRPSGK